MIGPRSQAVKTVPLGPVRRAARKLRRPTPRQFTKQRVYSKVWLQAKAIMLPVIWPVNFKPPTNRRPGVSSALPPIANRSERGVYAASTFEGRHANRTAHTGRTLKRPRKAGPRPGGSLEIRPQQAKLTHEEWPTIAGLSQSRV